jgi:hypothetical protein
MSNQKFARSHNQKDIYVSGIADVTQTPCRRSADTDADPAADVRLPGSPLSDLFLQKGFYTHQAKNT